MRAIIAAVMLVVLASTAEAQGTPDTAFSMETVTETITPTHAFPSLPVALVIHGLTPDQKDELVRTLMRRGDVCHAIGHRWTWGILPELRLSAQSTLNYRHCEVCGLTEGRKQ